MRFDRRSFMAASAAALLRPTSVLGQEVEEDTYFAGTAEDHGFVYRRTNMDTIDAV